MILPELEEFKKLWDGRSRVQIAKEIPADLETPVTAFLKLRSRGATFLFESVESGQSLARFSFLGLAPFLTVVFEQGKALLKHDHEQEELFLDESGPLSLLARLFSDHPIRSRPVPGVAGGAAVGYLSYDMVRHFEKLTATAREALNLPEAVFLFPETVLAFDQVNYRITVTTLADTRHDPENEYRKAVKRLEEVEEALLRGLPSDVNAGADKVKHDPVLTPSRKGFLKAAEKTRTLIQDGEVSQVVLSQRQEGKTRSHPFQIYRALRMLDPSPYMYYLDFDDFQMIGSSPTSLVSLEEGKAVVRPTAGTRPRGEGPQDKVLEQGLLADPRARAKHEMLVDLAKSELGTVSEGGRAAVEELMAVERTSHTMHLASRVTGKLLGDKTMFDLLRATFPAGAVTGAPKVKAMEVIEEMEETRRGPYGGSVGHFASSGSMAMCVAIRTIILRGENYVIQAGARVVADAEPEGVYEVVQARLKALYKAIESAEEGF
jgi:anthranilate synthase component 1